MNATASVVEPTNRPRLLIVEDEAVIGLDLAHHLCDFGYDVVGIASSGDRACELAQLHRPDLILMDIVIRGPRDGIETAGLIRAELDVPVVFLTAYSDAGTLDRAAQAAPYGYLLKPFRPPDLRTTIEVARQRHRTERLVAESERWLASTLQCLGDGVVVTDAEGRVRYMNPAAESLTGHRHDEVRDSAVHELVVLFDADAFESLPDPVGVALSTGVQTRMKAGTLRRPRDGEPMPVEVQASPIRDARDSLLGAVLVLRDISERRRAEAALEHLAHQDPLTGLPNRAALLRQIESMASNAGRLGSLLAVLFLDLDGFKQINDSFGHRAGDQLLVQAARRLNGALRAGDFVARLGGDEFVVLAGNLADAAQTAAVAGKLVEVLSQPYEMGERTMSLSASIGVSLCPLDGRDGASLLREADTAMYWAKGRGKNQFALYCEGPGQHTGVRADYVSSRFGA